ncbi:MAG: alpha/beta hydrolase-fold protein [Azospirillaceae bacterium]
MRRDRTAPAGPVHRLTIESDALADNRLGDPVARDVDVWLPPGHDGGGLPLLVDLAGFTNSGLGHTAWKNFGETLPERLDRLTHAGTLPPVVVAFPDCFTRLGGNQYVNSPAMGRWEDFLADDLTAAVEARFRCGGTGRRGLFGKSSGGYGALVNAIRRPDAWAAAACLSGDCAFELCYGPELPVALRGLARHGGSTEAFLAAFETANRRGGEEITTLMMLAMAASYDPDPKAPFGAVLPVDPYTCEILPERWAAWRAWDPLHLAARHPGALAGLRGLWIECGERDEYNLLYGARRLHRRLEDHGVAHEYREFPDGHLGIDYRLDEVLPWLAGRLAG